MKEYFYAIHVLNIDSSQIVLHCLLRDVSYFEDEDVGKVTFTKNINSNILDESNPKFIMCYESSDFCTGRNDCKCVIEQLADHFYNRAKDLKLLQSDGLVKAIVVESAGGGGGCGGDESLGSGSGTD